MTSYTQPKLGERLKNNYEKRLFPITNTIIHRHLIDKNHSYTDFSRNFDPILICNNVEEFEMNKAFKIKNENNKHQLMNDQLNFDSKTLYNKAIS